MSRMMTLGSSKAYYSYNRTRHCLDARLFVQGKLVRVTGRSLGEIKSELLVLANAAGLDVFTLMPARSE